MQNAQKCPKTSVLPHNFFMNDLSDTAEIKEKKKTKQHKT